MKATYWITTGLLALLLLSTGFLDITRQPTMVAGVTSLGYPEYFLTLDGLAKWAAAAAILIPGLVLMKEWAYAGLTFLTLGAAWSHLASHQSPAPPLFVLALVQASCLLWRRTRSEGATRVPPATAA
jgi:DoxX-like family